MSQWGQPSGYQYPLQTGYNPQFQQQQQPQQQQHPQNVQFQQGFGQSRLTPQPTGFPGQSLQGFQPQQTGFPNQQNNFQQHQTGFQQQPQAGFQQPQQTGYPGTPGIMQPQQTGFPGGNFQQGRPPPPPVPPIPSRFQTPGQGSGFLQPQQQQPPVNRFLTPSPGLTAQPTGFAAQPLLPQMTGFVDPRLQMMSSTFLPANPSSPYGAGGAPQLAPQQFQGGMNLQQSFQQHNQEQRGSVAPKVPWVLSKAEKKSYDQIFRAWDSGTGFISGATALEVFGASGLSKDDLARVWTLADIDDRGKLNNAEFHVAMGLIYRKLNGNEIPNELPPELVPPSARDLDTSVNFLKDVLKNETRSRSPSTAPKASRVGRDAGVYQHDDGEPPGGFYKSAFRNVDRTAVRSRMDDDSPIADLSDMKRQLENTAKRLDRAIEDDSSRTKEDEDLEREMNELKFRVKRVQEDLDYVSRGPRNTGKDEERRKLERELLKLLHERVPEVERKIKDREARKEREKREWNRERDRRNDRFGRYDDRDEFSSSRYNDRDRDGGYSSRDRGYDYDRDRDYRLDRDRSRSRERPRTPPALAVRSPPPPPPPAAPASSINQPPPPPPAPTASPAPVLKNMTPEERKAYARAEAARRIEARKQALGVTVPSAPTIDTSVEDRLAEEKKEAEEKAKLAEKQEEERARLRQQRLEGEKALKDGKSTSTPIAATPSSPIPEVKAPKAAPPPPKPRTAPAPPPPRGTSSRPPVVHRSPAPAAPPAAPPAPVEPEEDPEEQAFLARQETLRKQREARAARLAELEREEEEARLAEEQYQERRKALLTKTSAPSTPVNPPAHSPALAEALPTPATPSTASAPVPPPAPPAPDMQAVVAVSPPAQKRSNPFSQMMQGGTAPAPPVAPAANGGSNPFFRSQTVPPPASVPTPPKSPAPVSAKTAYHTAPGDSDNDWDDVAEKEDEDDSSDDELPRNVRTQIANQLFGNMLPRPQSVPAPSTSKPPTPAPPAPPPPPAPPAPLQATSGPVSEGAPPPPPPPPAPVVSAAPSTASAGPGDVSALLASIQNGAKLRKTVTVEKNAALSGKVLGDNAPPSHINAAPRPASPPQPQNLPDESASRAASRQSVDWYAGLAADQGVASPPVSHLPATVEEEESEVVSPATPVPDISVTEHDSISETDPMADVDMSIQHRVRTLYPYEGQRDEDISFGENLIVLAHPSKSGEDWWYGNLLRDGKSGFFPKTYVEVVHPVKAKALYAYTGSNPDELPFAEGDELTIVDKSEDEWWKAEQGGVVFIVPAAYLEVVEGQ